MGGMRSMWVRAVIPASTTKTGHHANRTTRSLHKSGNRIYKCSQAPLAFSNAVGWPACNEIGWGSKRI
eukprot:11418258-Heterocapsa_arctica.AAC.1